MPLKNIIRLYIPAMQATLNPPVGPILSQNGVNAVEFCKKFNELTNAYKSSCIFPVLILIYRNHALTFVVRRPTFFFFLKQALFLGDSPLKTAFLKKKGNYKYLKLEVEDTYSTSYCCCIAQFFFFELLSIKLVGLPSVTALQRGVRMLLGTAASARCYIVQN